MQTSKQLDEHTVVLVYLLKRAECRTMPPAEAAAVWLNSSDHLAT